jgi:hypothetical protein
MNQAEFHLKLVINLRYGAVPSRHTMDSQLRDIWGHGRDSNHVLKFCCKPKIVGLSDVAVH